MNLSESFKNRIQSLAGLINETHTVNTFLPETDTNKSEPEGAHYKQSLLSIIENAKKLHDAIKDSDDLDPWMQDKITLSKHNIEAVLEYVSQNGNSK